jgi:hypothetical protein
MGAFLKRHTWIVAALVLICCSGLTANAVAHIIAATALSERSEPVRGAAPRPAPRAAPEDGSRLVRPGQTLVERNIFCSA